jgi:F0F1-type ATP synthase membrane subunit b/b'
MSTPQDPGRAPASPALTALPRLEDLPQAPGGGYDAERVREAFDAFRRHSAQLQAQLRVLQAAGRSSTVEPTGHAVRMDALHLIRGAAEFADTLERDAQTASATQLARTEEEVRNKQKELQDREAEIERFRQESERQRAEILNSARNEAREQLQNAQRDATQERREAEARAARLLEQARHQATELTNAARAEVEQTLEWARAQASTVLNRAQKGAEQLLASAGLGQEQLTRVADAIVRAADESGESTRPSGVVSHRPAEAVAGPRPTPPAPPVSGPPVSAQAPEEPPSSPPVSIPSPAAPPVTPAAPPTTPPSAPPASEAESSDRGAEGERDEPQA